jgi:MOSC domain-containing protein YiiM
MSGKVVAVCRAAQNGFSKPPCDRIDLVEGLGVDGDAHSGTTVQHLYLKKKDPTVANKRQVHLMHAELFDELEGKGFTVGPGDIGENITTRGIDLLALPCGTRLTIGETCIELTGIRTPCVQIDAFRKGLLKALVDTDEGGNKILKSGVMGIVLQSGAVRPGDTVAVALPAGPHQPLPAL